MIIRDNQDETPIIFKGKKYAGFSQLGFSEGGAFVLDLWTTPLDIRRGSLFTAIPISSLKYRRNHGSNAYAERIAPNAINLYSDLGEQYQITAPSKIINQLWQECIEQELAGPSDAVRVQNTEVQR